ncbi:hypothetical protein TSAR_002691 [Trichomalopsis sarcophagae]|uniref:Uncharacterized protein n=1 Tax=Trichomalopsis sarcophagae TaxID=543379 RepID=A0A232ERQ1_9HYME|nr:hypothetical protein TSAR_002691 [Trichomalopsis sarcophagae]
MAGKSDLIGVTINSQNFACGSAGISLRSVANFFVDDLWMLVSGVTQSNENFEIDDNFSIEATYAEVPHGAGRKKSFGINMLGQRSLISIIRNSDNLCYPRALVVGEAFVNLKEDATNTTKKAWTIIRDSRRTLQKERALGLTAAAGVTIPLDGSYYRGGRSSADHTACSKLESSGRVVSVYLAHACPGKQLITGHAMS